MRAAAMSGRLLRLLMGWRCVPTSPGPLPLLALALGLSGCATMSSGRGWGQDVTLTPGWERVRKAAWNAAAAPETWVPAAGALALQIDDADQAVVEWAAQNTPIYGSQQNADRMSDDLKQASVALWAVSALATPSGGPADTWFLNKVRGISVQLGSDLLLEPTVKFLKEVTDRERPNGDDHSFPSGHAATTSLFNTMATKNVEVMGWPATATTLTHVGLEGLTVATAWARVEANRHYPSDVLAGMALGHFFGSFFTDAFLGLDDPHAPTILFTPSRNGVAAAVRLAF